jgi:hypothetical protein
MKNGDKGRSEIVFDPDEQWRNMKNGDKGRSETVFDPDEQWKSMKNGDKGRSEIAFGLYLVIHETNFYRKLHY